MNNLLGVFLLSMVPVCELRGAIPLGFAWGIHPALVVLAAVLGNLLPMPFLIVFGGKILRYFAKFEKFGKPFRWFLTLGERKTAKMLKTGKKLFWGLMTFVAIPLPMTGAWTGALISITLQLDLKKSMPAIALGVAVAGAIITACFLWLSPEVFKALFG